MRDTAMERKGSCLGGITTSPKKPLCLRRFAWIVFSLEPQMCWAVESLLFMLSVAHRPAGWILQTDESWGHCGPLHLPCLTPVPRSLHIHTLLQPKLNPWITISWLQTSLRVPYPKLVFGAPVEILNGAGELVAVVAWLEAISLGQRRMTWGERKQPGEQWLTRQPL